MSKRKSFARIEAHGCLQMALWWYCDAFEPRIDAVKSSQCLEIINISLHLDRKQGIQDEYPLHKLNEAH